MTYVRSFTHIERKLMHHYRDQINHAESEEDVKKFFCQTIRELLNGVMDGESDVRYGDIELNPSETPHFSISERLSRNETFQELQHHSDLTAILRRFTEPAVKRCRHLRGHPEKTEAKLRHNL